MKGVHWIDTGQWPPAIALINDKRAYRKFMRKHCSMKPADCEPWPPRDGGFCQKLQDGTDCIFVIAIGEQSDQTQLAGSLAHEATHAMRWLFEHIQEKEPGIEAQAYLVEHIVRKGLEVLSA